MCNVYSMYSYDPTAKSIDGQYSEQYPPGMCWGNSQHQIAK